MKGLWKKFRTNLLYWRFRYVTRNRLRLQQVFNRRTAPTAVPYRGRATALYPGARASRPTWIAFLLMVCVLTALQVGEARALISHSLMLAGTIIVVGAVFYYLQRRT